MASLFFTELGSSKISTAKIETRSNKLNDFHSVDVYSSESSGIVNGYIDNSPVAISSITKHIEGAEKYFGKTVHKTHLCLSDIQTILKQTEMTLETGHRKRVDAELQDEVKRLFFEHYVDREAHVLHVVNDGFQIDGSDWMSNPFGFSGNKIQARVISIESRKPYIQELHSLFSQSGATIDKVIFIPFMMSSNIARTCPSKAFMIIDIGQSKTDIMVVHHGIVRKIHHIKIGGLHFTKDLSHFSGSTKHESERIKLSLEKLSERDEFPRMIQIIDDRSRELTKIIKSKISTDLIDVEKVYLTGGGSKTIGLNHKIRDELQREVLYPFVQNSVDFHSPSFDTKDCGGLILTSIESSGLSIKPSHRVHRSGLVGSLIKAKTFMSQFL